MPSGSGQNPYLALLAYCSKPIDAHLHSPAEILYQQVIHTTVPQWIMHTNPHANDECDHLNQCTTQSAEYHDQWGCCKKPPFFAGQTISVLSDARNMWLPDTIICKANNGSYLVQVIGGGQYRHAHDHIQEHNPDAVKPDTSNTGNVEPAASTPAPAIQVVRLPTAATPTTQTPAAPAATLSNLHTSSAHRMFTKMNTDAIHCSPSGPDQHSPLLSYANQFEAGSHHPGFLKRYRSRLSFADEPDDAMTKNTPGATAEVLYSLTSHLWQCDSMYQHSNDNN